MINYFYLVPSNPLSWDAEKAALNNLTPDARALGQSVKLGDIFGNSPWGATAIPGEPAGRWVLEVGHTESGTETQLAKVTGIVPFPHVYAPDPVGPTIAAAVGPWAGVLATDTTLQTLAKLRAVGYVGARPERL